VTLIVDAGALYAQADGDDPFHAAVADVLVAERRQLVTSQIAATEADYLVMTRLGVDAEIALLDDLASGTFVAECLTRPELELARDLVRRYRDLKIGLADASIVVLAHRFRTRRLCTVDERCFRAMTPLQGGSFTLLPADA
jgi:predicted nucleic acid-binding protein